MRGGQSQAPRSLLGSLHLEQRREDGKERITVTVLQDHAAAHEFRESPAAADPESTVLFRGMLLDQLEKINRRRREFVAYRVPLSPGYHDEIALGQVNRRTHTADL